MDPTGTLTDDSEAAAVDGLPLLPTLPPLPTLPLAPMLPSRSPVEVSTVVTGYVTGEVTPEARVSLGEAWVSPSSKRMNHPAANAPYGVLPSKPRAGEPSQAALLAAEQRRRTKKRRRTRRLVMLVIAIAVIALAGPPTARWIADGFAKAGSIEPESVPAGDDTD
jgi:hypothetical protein